MKAISRTVLAVLLGWASWAFAAEPKAVTNEPTFKPPFETLPTPDTKPRPKFQSRPTYPAEFRGSGVVGEVVVTFVVDKDGKTRQVQFTKATDIAFARAAIDAVSKWVWLPALKDNKPVPAQVAVPVIFREAPR